MENYQSISDDDSANENTAAKSYVEMPNTSDNDDDITVTTTCGARSCVPRIATGLQNALPDLDCSPSTENIISFVWAAFILFVGIIFTVAQYTSTLKRFSFTTTYWVLFSFFIVAIIGMAVSIKYRNNNKFTIGYDEVDDETEKTDEDVSSKYLIGCAFVFAIGNLLLDMFAMLTVLHCGLGLTLPVQKVEYAVQFLFHATRAIYTALQLIFLQVFHGTKIQRGVQLFFKLLVVHMISTNFCVWFAFLVIDTGVFSKATNITTALLNCTSNPGDELYASVQNLDIYLQPFILQYGLLTCMIFYAMYPLKEVFGKDPDRRRKYNYGAIDSVKRDDSKLYKSDPGLTIGILVAMFLLISSWGLQSSTHFIQNLRFHYATEIVVHILIIISSFCVYKEISHYHSKEKPHRKYKIEDYILLITGLVGFLPFFIAVIFSVTKRVSYENNSFPRIVNQHFEAHQGEIRALVGVLAVMNTAAVLVQMFFLMIAQTYKRVAFSYRLHDSSLDISDYRSDYRKLRSSARIGQWLMFLFVLNVALWVCDQFFGVEHTFERTYWVSNAYWGEKVWLFITKLLYPLLIYYRFHSALMIVGIWLNFRVKKKLL